MVRARKCAQDVSVQEDGESIWTKKEEVKAEWRKLRNEKLHDLYIIWVITSRRMRLVRHVARVGEKRYPEFGWRILKERGHLEDKELDRRIPFNPLNPELNPICYLLALLAHHFLHVSRIRVKSLTLRLLMSYIYGVPNLDVSRSYTTTHHSR